MNSEYKLKECKSFDNECKYVNNYYEFRYKPDSLKKSRSHPTISHLHKPLGYFLGLSIDKTEIDKLNFSGSELTPEIFNGKEIIDMIDSYEKDDVINLHSAMEFDKFIRDKYPGYHVLAWEILEPEKQGKAHRDHKLLEHFTTDELIEVRRNEDIIINAINKDKSNEEISDFLSIKEELIEAIRDEVRNPEIITTMYNSLIYRKHYALLRLKNPYSVVELADEYFRGHEQHDSIVKTLKEVSETNTKKAKEELKRIEEEENKWDSKVSCGF